MISNKIAHCFFVAMLIMVIAQSCFTLPRNQDEAHAKYSHTLLKENKHYLAYTGIYSMTLELATEKWLLKAEKLCKTREFDYELNKQELRGKDFSEDKYPFIEGNIYCIKDTL